MKRLLAFMFDLAWLLLTGLVVILVIHVGDRLVPLFTLVIIAKVFQWGLTDLFCLD